MILQTKRPPYAARLDRLVGEVRVYFGRESAWRYARNDERNRRGVVIEPGVEYDLSCARGRAVLLIALDGATAREVAEVARKLLIAGAAHVAAISPTGSYKMFEVAA